VRDVKTTLLRFWFEETSPQQWFQSNADFDALILRRFGPDYALARDGIFDGWRRDEEGCLALCLMFDQLPRNMFRNTSRAYESDGRALDIARHAVAKGLDTLLPVVRRAFIYMPFMHSEDKIDQDISVKLFEAIRQDNPTGYAHALRHREVIEKFGRFPTRNNVLGRPSTEDEKTYLAASPFPV